LHIIPIFDPSQAACASKAATGSGTLGLA
jgi:hypothetical protein